jgi:predicted ATPase
MRDAAQRHHADALGQFLFPVSASVVNLWLRNYAAVLELTARLEEVGEQYGVQIFIGWARLYSGWAQAMTGDASGGITRLSNGLAIHVNVGQRLGLNHSLGLLAEAQIVAGRYDAAVATIDDALALSDHPVQLQHTTELRRLRGRVAAEVGADDEAEDILRAALDEAASGGAVLIEVRVATELLPVLARTGRVDEGRGLVTGALARMEGDALDRRVAEHALITLEETRAGS